MPSLVEVYSGNGIFISWEWNDTSGSSTLRISRSDYGNNGPWTEIDNVDYPEYAYIDTDGAIDSYYLLEEIDESETVLYTHPVIWGEEALLRADIYYEIQRWQQLRIYREQLMPNMPRNKFRSAVGSWNLDPSPEIWIPAANAEETGGWQMLSTTECIFSTTNEVDDDYPNGLKYNLDYNGVVSFYDGNDTLAAIRSYDDIYASYSFKLFSYHQINEALKRAFYAIIGQPGICKYNSVGEVPIHWDHALIVGASAILMRQAQNWVMTPEGAAIVSIDMRSVEGISKERETMQRFFAEKYKEYQEEFDELKKLLAIETYPGPHIIATPEMMLPGGRSRFFNAAFRNG